jgi:predicted peptidase
MGGGATWALAIAHPEKFAAIVPVCGSYDPAEAKKLVGLPVWAFHGAKDKVVPIEFDQKMVGAIKAAGGNVKFTIYPEAGHDVWSQTYSNPEMYRWLFQQKRQH